MYRSLRRRILTPATSATKPSVRGFDDKTPAATELLDTVGRTFLTGYGYAAEARRPLDGEEKLEELPARFRGFAYEGAATGFAVRDGLPPGNRRGVAEFLTGRVRAHVYMAYVGVDWAMAGVPRFRRPAMTASASDDLLRWYADRAIDQGIGRAMWFVAGTDPVPVADLVEKFPQARRADLRSGAPGRG